MRVESRTGSVVILDDGTRIPSHLSEPDMVTILGTFAYLGGHDKIKAIKQCRALLGCGLREAKLTVEETMAELGIRSRHHREED